MRLLIVAFVCIGIVGCSASNEKNNEVLPEQVLQSYFDSIANNDFKAVVSLYGGDYDLLQSYNPDISPTDYESLFRNFINHNGGQIVKIEQIHDKKNISDDEFQFDVTFTQEGEKFRNGLHYTYTVKKINGQWKVMELPPYLS